MSHPTRRAALGITMLAPAGLVAFRLAQDPAQRDRPIVTRFREQLRVAAEAIDAGLASAKLAEWVAATQR